jgi:hypothetical protein
MSTPFTSPPVPPPASPPAPGERYPTFEAFWPYYLGEHADKLNRRMHFVGTACALATLATAVTTLNPALLAFAPLFGYGFAWVGHFVVEKNRPATFTYPLWSLRGDFRMFFLMCTGALGPHLERAGVR